APAGRWVRCRAPAAAGSAPGRARPARAGRARPPRRRRAPGGGTGWSPGGRRRWSAAGRALRGSCVLSCPHCEGHRPDRTTSDRPSACPPFVGSGSPRPRLMSAPALVGPTPSGHRAGPWQDGAMRLFSTPSRLYRVLALAEVVTWTLLLAGMLLKYVLQVTEVLVRIGGGLHGFVFLAYVVVTVLVAVDQRWRARDLLLGLGSAIIPYLTVPFERSAHRRGLLGESWRLREETGRTAPARVVSLALRRPLPAALVTLVVLVIVFSLLLMAGPPTQWFS